MVRCREYVYLDASRYNGKVGEIETFMKAPKCKQNTLDTMGSGKQKPVCQHRL